MKKLFILFLFLTIEIFPQSKSLNGVVKDSETKAPLQFANVFIKGKNIGTSTNEIGKFQIINDLKETDTLVISYIGYKDFVKIISDLEGSFINAELQRIILPSQTILVEATVGQKGITPVSFDKISKDEIQKDYLVQDIPDYLSQLPSTIFYSENGNGIGYNYLSIRGFDQRRISVSINGIPQNDPEDHNIYWLDFPDLLASSELIQVQRGAGSGVIGYPAIGGSINIITSPFSDKSNINLSTFYGSYNTRKYSASFSSGLINNKYSMYGKISQILSSGYKNSAWAKFNSYHFSVVRYDDRLTTQLNFYGGPISDGLAYTGVAKFAVKDKKLRKENYSDWGADENGYTYTVVRRPDEIEEFSQPHFEILNEYQFNNKVKFNSALFLVLGEGFFDYDGSWAIPDYGYDDYFRLKLNGFDSTMIPSNALIRAMVSNKQIGWIPRISFNHTNGQLILGAEFRVHRSEHWGSINFADNLPSGLDKNYRYYSYNGAKDILNAFVHESYNFNDRINILGELQLAFHRYNLYNEKYLNNDFTVDNLFINPKVGINYKLDGGYNIFLSYARVTREPRLKDYYDAAESSAGELPHFNLINDTTYNFNSPLIKPEIMNDIELGSSFNSRFFSINFNLFYMSFNNEIVKNGKLDRFGQPVVGNVNRSVHTGAEFSAIIKFNDFLELFGNATYSNNKIVKGSTFIQYNISEDSTVIAELKLDGNRLSGFPDLIANIGATFNYEGIYMKLSAKYVGEFYSDNYDMKIKNYLNDYPAFIGYNDNINDSYFVLDFFGSYEISLFNSMTKSKIYMQVNNIFDNLYSAYAIGKEFFPAADRNFIAGIQIGL
jgi:iron complex outermembrane receptor protein